MARKLNAYAKFVKAQYKAHAKGGKCSTDVMKSIAKAWKAKSRNSRGSRKKK